MRQFKKSYVKKIIPKIDKILIYVSIASATAIIINLGFDSNILSNVLLNKIIQGVFYFIGIILFFRILVFFNREKKPGLIEYTEVLLLLYFIIVSIASNYLPFKGYINFENAEWLYVGIFATLLIEFSKKSLFFDRFYFNPTLLFVLSFLFLILVGTSLLLLPKASIGGQLSFIDALFTSTSAVCITGLTVINPAVELTFFGQNILLFLFQLGGIGIMTFTGFFGYFFTGGFSYKNQLMYTELIGENKLASVIRTLYKIIFITFFFEAVGALFIYINVDESLFSSHGEHIYFSAFHAISAFCNAGFTTLENGLMDNNYRFNYNLQVVLALLFILGGLGFGIVLNVYTFIKRWLRNLYNLIRYKERLTYKPWIISFNSRIILYTTSFLILFAFISIFLLEYNNTLTEHKGIWGKSVSAFFMAVVPRTAGFTTVDMNHLTFPVIIIYLFLMWVGASPGSTGGGIKTTTFAVSFLNIFSIAKGQEHIEVFRRQISSSTVKRALSIITLSLFIIIIALFILSISDGDKGFKALLFEVFAAFSTAGLTFGITPDLSKVGKIVLVFTMFIGRVGALTLLIAFIKNSKLKTYQYPSEEIEL